MSLLIPSVKIGINHKITADKHWQSNLYYRKECQSERFHFGNVLGELALGPLQKAKTKLFSLLLGLKHILEGVHFHPPPPLTKQKAPSKPPVVRPPQINL